MRQPISKIEKDRIRLRIKDLTVEFRKTTGGGYIEVRGRHNFFQCVEETCAQSCSARAFGSALRDRLLKDRSFGKCNHAVLPKEDGVCYDALHMTQPTGALLEDMQRRACEQRQGLMQPGSDGTMSCAGLPLVIADATMNPCNDPRAYCAPDDPRSSGGSVPLPTGDGTRPGEGGQPIPH